MNPSTDTKDDLLTQVEAFISEVTPDLPADFGLESRLREDIGLDSVSQMELISVVDESLGLEVDIEEVLGLATVADVIGVIERYRGGAAGA